MQCRETFEYKQGNAGYYLLHLTSVWIDICLVWNSMTQLQGLRRFMITSFLHIYLFWLIIVNGKLNGIAHVVQMINVIHFIQLRRWVWRGFRAQFGRRARPCRLHAQASLHTFFQSNIKRDLCWRPVTMQSCPLQVVRLQAWVPAYGFAGPEQSKGIICRKGKQDEEERDEDEKKGETKKVSNNLCGHSQQKRRSHSIPKRGQISNITRYHIIELLLFYFVNLFFLSHERPYVNVYPN